MFSFRYFYLWVYVYIHEYLYNGFGGTYLWVYNLRHEYVYKSNLFKYGETTKTTEEKKTPKKGPNQAEPKQRNTTTTQHNHLVMTMVEWPKYKTKTHFAVSTSFEGTGVLEIIIKDISLYFVESSNYCAKRKKAAI